jgi:hypothetical protein
MYTSTLKRRARFSVVLLLAILMCIAAPSTAQIPGFMGGPWELGPMQPPRWMPMYVPWWGNMFGVYPMWRMNPFWTPPVPVIPYYHIPWLWPGTMGMVPPRYGTYSGGMGYDIHGMYGTAPGRMGYGSYPHMMHSSMWPNMPGYSMYPSPMAIGGIRPGMMGGFWPSLLSPMWPSRK